MTSKHIIRIEIKIADVALRLTERENIDPTEA
jgi:hypothetical protein